MTGAHALAWGADLSEPSCDAAAADDARRLREIVAHLPEGAGSSFVSSTLPGGLTNRNYRVTLESGRSLVVRLSSPQSALVTIDRDHEYVAAAAAAEAGVGPAVVAYLPRWSALVIEWIEGRTLGAADLDDSAMLARVAHTCRRLHEGPRFATSFDMFALTRRYLELVRTRGFRLPATYGDFATLAAQIEAAMAVRPEPSVPCHNDLLPANVMANADRLWLIDFEYAGNGDPYFELGNLCSEAQLGSSRLEELVRAYDESAGAAPTCAATVRARFARARLHALMSNYGWTLWACIQSATSDLDFDFYGWGLEKYERAVAEFTGPDLSGLLQDVQQL